MRVPSLLYAALAAVPVAVFAQPMPDGFLCCNMRTDGSWISDANYAESGKRIIPVGTPTKVTGYGRNRVFVEIGGAKQAIGNDYSRDLDLGAFAQRYVVTEDPAKKIATYAAKVQTAIKSARIVAGMTREQVLMAVGYPMSSENPNLDAKIWRYWLSSFAEFQVIWGADNRVKEISTDPATRNVVVME